VRHVFSIIKTIRAAVVQEPQLSGRLCHTSTREATDAKGPSQAASTRLLPSEQTG